MQCQVYVSGLNFICFNKNKRGKESSWHVIFFALNHSFPISKVEKSEFCQALIRQRISEGQADNGKIFPWCGQLSHQRASGWISRGLPLSRGIPCWGGPWNGWFAQWFSISCVAPMGWTGGTRAWPDSRLVFMLFFKGWNSTQLMENRFQINSPFFGVECIVKTKASQTSSSGNLSCWKTSARSWLKSFGVCLTTSSRKLEHTHTNTFDPFATPVHWPLSVSGGMQEAQKRGLKVAYATINGKMAGAHVDYSVMEMVSKEKVISTNFHS